MPRDVHVGFRQSSDGGDSAVTVVITSEYIKGDTGRGLTVYMETACTTYKVYG
jgi:hypothetical protein